MLLKSFKEKKSNEKAHERCFRSQVNTNIWQCVSYIYN